MDINSLSHTKWNCKYHIVFAPKYRRKVIYGKLYRDIANILSTLCKRKGVKIVEAEMCPDHVHMLVEIPPSMSVAQFVGYLKGKSTLMIFERHANLKYKYGNRHFWYDDREIVKTDLIESYNQLLEFGRKNLPDKFFLEGVVNKSLRNTIVREMVSNTLMHREFTSSYTAKFVIEKDRMYVENANRASKEGFITVDNLEPNPKNPIIAAFFRNIGYADQLGSGVRKLFKYSKYYSGRDPEFIEDDVFRIIVPLDDDYSVNQREPICYAERTPREDWHFTGNCEENSARITGKRYTSQRRWQTVR